MGRPSFPTREEQQELRAAAKLSPTELRLSRHDDVATAALELLPHSLALIEVVR
jgi:hypothetical protein